MIRNASWCWLLCLCLNCYPGVAQHAAWQGQWLLHESAWFTQESFCLDSLPEKEGAYLLLTFDKSHRLRLSVAKHAAICESPVVQTEAGSWWTEGDTLLIYLKGAWSDGHAFEYKIQYTWKVVPGYRCLKILRILHLSE